MKTLRQLKAAFRDGGNIAQLMRAERRLEHNSCEIIETAYDLQAGGYQSAARNPEYSAYLAAYSAEIASTLLALGQPDAIMEAGVGEATTFAGVLLNLDPERRLPAFGFDLSWSRVAYARRWLLERHFPDVTLCTGNLFDLPFADNAIDIVYTSHSIEPNGGHERDILEELYRVTGRFLVLFEPGYELAGSEARRRMESHGYCRGLVEVAQALGYRVLEHKLFGVSANPLNPTAVTIIEKPPGQLPAEHVLACPRYKTPLIEAGNLLYSAEALMAYPIIKGIPCLRVDNGILASGFEELAAA